MRLLYTIILFSLFACNNGRYKVRKVRYIETGDTSYVELDTLYKVGDSLYMDHLWGIEKNKVIILK